MNTIVFTNATVVQTKKPFAVTANVDVVVKGDKIEAVGPSLATKYPKAKVIDVTNKIIMPGMVCSHHHFYSVLSRGMLVKTGPQNDLTQVLKEWWWRLDRALDEESVYYSALICSLEAIMCGTTTCIDHHASPSFISGSLQAIAKGVEEVGMRAMTCYEVTDRNRGLDEVKEGIKENIEFAKSVDEKYKRNEDVLVEAMIGGHAPYTVPNAGLEMMKEASDITKRGIHLHAAEDKYDVSFSHHNYNLDVMQRLDNFGLLDEKSILVHGLFFNEGEIDLLNERKTYLAHNARSNMNNNVGYIKHLDKVANLLIGSDGCDGNMFEELKFAFFKNRDMSLPFNTTDYVNFIGRGNEFLEKYFNAKFGRVEAGYKADLIVVDYKNPTPLVDENVATHLVWGFNTHVVNSTMVNGRLLMHNRQFDLDIDEIFAKSQGVAKKLWERVEKIKP